MATDFTTTTPNMSLVIPTPGASPGPLYATDVNGAFQRIDLHDHSAGLGVQITPSGMNISSDLDFQSHNAIALRAVRLSNLSVLPALGADLNELCDINGDLWWINSTGTGVQITAGGSLNSGALVSSIWANVTKSVNYTILPSDTFIVVLVDASTAPRTITLPAASAVTSGRFYQIKDYLGQSGTNNVTIAAAGADTIDGAGTQVLRTAYDAVFVMSDGASKWTMFRVRSLNGASVPASGALVTGNVLQVSGANALTYGPVNLAGGSSYVTGVLPAPNLGLATTGQSGAVQLVNDLSGTATAPSVVGVSGSPGNPLVIGSAGAGPSSIRFGSPDLRWADSIVLPKLGILARTSTGAPTSLSVYGQDAYSGGGATAAPGGPVDIRGGASFGASGGDANTQGAVTLTLGGTAIKMGVVEVVTTRGVCALGGVPTTSDLGANTGNIVTWMREANVVPSANPTTGFLMYSSGGIPFMRGSNLNAKAVGFTNTTSGFATSGSGGAPPAQVAGFLTININGTDQKIPYYNV